MERAGPRSEADGLLTLEKDVILILEEGLAAVLLLSLGLTEADHDSETRGLIAGLLLIAAWLQANDALVIERATLTGLTGRYYTRELGGHPVRFLDLAIEGRVKVSLDLGLNLFALPRLKTERPIGIEVRGVTLRWAMNLSAFPEADVASVPVFDVAWAPESGISYDVGEQTFIENTPLVITKLGMGRWESGYWLDLGVKFAKDAGNFAVSVVPELVRLWFLSDGSFDHVSFKGLSFSLLVPPCLYCKGSLQTGSGADGGVDVDTGEARAFLVRAKPDGDYKERSCWVWDLEVGIRHESLPDGSTSLVVTGDLNNSQGIPICGTGTSLYGLFGLYAQNARPALGGAGYDHWYLEKTPKNRVTASKFEGAPDLWAAGFGVVLGSSGDGGRTWNSKAAVIILDGPVILVPATLNLLKERPNSGDEQAAAFKALVTLDFVNSFYGVTVVADYKKPEDGKLVAIHAPLEAVSHTAEPSYWHLYLGRHLPEPQRIRVRHLGEWDASGYLMIDAQDIANLGGSGLDLGGTALALGGKAAWESGRKKGKLQCFFRAGVAFHLGIGDRPVLFVGTLRVFGGVVVKVLGFGFEFQINAWIDVVAPDPFYMYVAIQVVVNLPWPLPDSDAIFDCTWGQDDALPAPEAVVAGLDLHPRGVNRPRTLQEGILEPDVPIDPEFVLSFAYPTRNAAGQTASFNLAGVDTQVIHVTSGGQGYAFALEGLTLWKGEPGTGTILPGPFPALWFDSGAPAAGGQPSRRVLQLFAYNGLLASRYIGTSADYVGVLTEDWDPCPPAGRPEAACYGFDQEPLGPVAPGRELDVPGAPVLRVGVLAEPPNAESVRRQANLFASPAEVVSKAVPGFDPRGVRLPSTNGFATPSPGSPPLAAETLELRVERARKVDLDLLRPRRDGRVVVRFFDAQGLVWEDDHGTVLGNVGETYERVRYHGDGPLTRVELIAFHRQDLRAETAPGSFLYQACLLYEAVVRSHEDAMANAQAWGHLWSDRIGQQAAGSGALLLEPGTSYALEAKVRWSYADNGAETPGGLRTHVYRFRTVEPDQPPMRRLRGEAAAIDPGAWDIATLPADGSAAVYRDRPIRLTFRDPRLDAVYRGFGRRLVLRLIDDGGHDLFDRLAFLAENATDLPEYQGLWRGEVLGHPCAPGGVDSLWQVGVAHFPTILEADRWYQGDLVPVPDPNGNVDLSTVDWPALEPVYGCRFRTSRWSNLTEHLAAYALRDEITAAPPDLGALPDPAGQPPDDQALEHALSEVVGLPPRPPAPTPEVVRIWRREGPGDDLFALVGVLLDGPEPLVRGAATTVAVGEDLSNPIPHAERHAQSGARTLLLFRDGDGFGAAPQADLTIRVTDAYTDANGQPAAETASRTLPVPARPPFFEEMAP